MLSELELIPTQRPRVEIGRDIMKRRDIKDIRGVFASLNRNLTKITPVYTIDQRIQVMIHK